jgi:hypothetical protein
MKKRMQELVVGRGGVGLMPSLLPIPELPASLVLVPRNHK